MEIKELPGTTRGLAETNRIQLSRQELKLYLLLQNFGAHTVEEITAEVDVTKEGAYVLLNRLNEKLSRFTDEKVETIYMETIKLANYFIEKNNPTILR